MSAGDGPVDFAVCISVAIVAAAATGAIATVAMSAKLDRLQVCAPAAPPIVRGILPELGPPIDPFGGQLPALLRDLEPLEDL